MDVLLVEAEEAERFRLSEALKRDGCGVVTCPGPLGPDYTCVGGRTGRCPLIAPADVIVLDLWLPGEDLIMGTTALGLLGLYVSSRTPVVALGAPAFARGLYGEERLTFLPRHPHADELAEAVHDVMVIHRRSRSDPIRLEER